MKETSNDGTNRELRIESRRLWPWIFSAILLCLFAVGLSLWWPIHQANRLIDFPETNGGSARVVYNHPDWMSGIVPEKLCIPKYDRLESYAAPDAAIPDRLLRQLYRFPEIDSLTLDISACHPENVEVLGELKKLHHVTLTGNGEPIPLDWIKNDPDLQHIELNNIPVRPQQWNSALSTTQITGLQTFNHERAVLFRYALVGQSTVQNYLGIFIEDLTNAEAIAMLDLPNLTRVVLEYSHADEEFWKTLSQCQNINQLSIYEQQSGRPLSEQALLQLENIKSLKTLTLIDHPELTHEQNLTPAWKRFMQKRPDVEIIEVSSQTPE